MKSEKTDQGESMTQRGGFKNIGLLGIKEPATVYYDIAFLGEYKGIIVEKRDCCQREETTGTSYEFISEDIHIWYGNVESSKRIKTRFENAKPYIQMLFSIRAHSSYKFESGNCQTFQFSNQEYNTIVLPDEPMWVELKPDTHIESLSINLSPALFFRYFPDSVSVFPGFQKNAAQKIPSRLSKQNLPITPKISLLLYDILHCRLSGYSKRLYIEAKIIELLAIQLDQYEQSRTAVFYPDLKQEEVEKMQQVQQLISNNPEKPFSLKDLSRQVGTNEYNLKKYFKQVFGITVFGYLQNCRMEKAKRMLAEENMKIAEVGRQLGYKHATHFTAAFKKYFGFLPNKIKAFFFVNIFGPDLSVLLECL
ncbi:helix-turn-helix transcriptional regulator [Larkinella bovis]|uniref:Helix-turn-helix transcriptional regulator n=1 Tax=Larkinella bovis TaxID=683041 RepID=A0ABW0IL84_9BACT